MEETERNILTVPAHQPSVQLVELPVHVGDQRALLYCTQTVYWSRAQPLQLRPQTHTSVWNRGSMGLPEELHEPVRGQYRYERAVL